MLQISLLITVIICLIPLAIFLTKKISIQRKYHIVICGMPRTGKTRLYQFCLNKQLPETVKSAQLSYHDGSLDIAPNVDTILVDLPSDGRLNGRYKYDQISDLVFLYKTSETQQAIVTLAELITKLSKRCKVYICSVAYDSEVYDHRKDFKERLNEEICRLENTKIDENVIDQHIEFLRFDLWNADLLEAQIAYIFKGKHTKALKAT